MRGGGSRYYITDKLLLEVRFNDYLGDRKSRVPFVTSTAWRWPPARVIVRPSSYGLSELSE